MQQITPHDKCPGRGLLPLLGLLVLLTHTACMPEQIEDPDPDGRYQTLIITDPMHDPVKPTWLAIAPERAVPFLRDLALWRHRQGHIARVIAVERICFHFGPSLTDDQAILRYLDFLRHRSISGKPTEYLLLVGTADPLDPNGFYLPTTAARSGHRARWSPFDALDTNTATATQRFNLQNNPDTDNKPCGDFGYSLARDGKTPQVAVGRLPARNVDQLLAMVGNIIMFEENCQPDPWRRQIDLIWTQQNRNQPPDLPALQWLKRIAQTWHLDLHTPDSRSTYAVPANLFNAHLVKQLNTAPAILIYQGPGSRMQWGTDQQPILNAKRIRGLFNAAHRTLVIALSTGSASCDRRQPSLGETLITETEGPAMYLGLTGPLDPDQRQRLADDLAKAFFQHPRTTLGANLLLIWQYLTDTAAQRKHASTQPTTRPATQPGADPMLAWQLTLLGDPASSVTWVADTAALQAPEQAHIGQRIQVTVYSKIMIGRAVVELQRDRATDRQHIRPLTQQADKLTRAMENNHLLANDPVVCEAGAQLFDGTATWQISIPRGVKPGQYQLVTYVRSTTEDAIARQPIQILPAQP